MKAFRLTLVIGIPIWLLAALLPALGASVLIQPPTEVPPDTGSVSVRSGSIVLKVRDYNQARSRVMKLAAEWGAASPEEKSVVDFAGERHGDITLELDAAQLGPLMDDIRRLGKLYSEQVQTTDHTSYCQKLAKQVSLLQQNERELLVFLRGPRRMRSSDILFVQYRLYQSRVEAANAAQERADIVRRSQRARINVALFEPEPRKTFDWSNWHAVASYRAKGSFLYVTRKLVTGSYFMAFFAPFWIPALLILFFGGRRLIRWTRQRVTSLLAERRTTRQDSAPAQTPSQP
jgi:hypothetical protein